MRSSFVAITLAVTAAATLLAGCSSDSAAQPSSSAPTSAVPTPEAISVVQVEITAPDGTVTDEWSSEEPGRTGELEGLLLASGAYEQTIDLHEASCADSDVVVIDYTTGQGDYSLTLDACADADDTRQNVLESSLMTLVESWRDGASPGGAAVPEGAHLDARH